MVDFLSVTDTAPSGYWHLIMLCGYETFFLNQFFQSAQHSGVVYVGKELIEKPRAFSCSSNSNGHLTISHPSYISADSSELSHGL